ncbi:hypothetical protein HanRHA438_Chr05g0238381 [Helianthus annuus]|nr:hypothetical protein HanRHA438_Chr05g0238381 [Helianthus annuus]
MINIAKDCSGRKIAQKKKESEIMTCGGINCQSVKAETRKTVAYSLRLICLQKLRTVAYNLRSVGYG